VLEVDVEELLEDAVCAGSGFGVCAGGSFLGTEGGASPETVGVEPFVVCFFALGADPAVAFFRRAAA